MTRTLNLLIVEDSLEDAKLLVYQLKDAGFVPAWRRVETETEYRAALSEDLDIIVSDLRLPQFSGERALAVLRESGLDVPLIVVSGTIGEEGAVDLLKGGATDVVLKDRMVRLTPAVERALREVQDREERRQVEDALRKSEKNLREAQRIGRVGSWELDLATERLEWSDETYRIFGCDPKSFTVSKEAFYEMVHLDDRSRVQATIKESLRTGNPYAVEHRIIRADGSERVVEERAEVFYDSSGKARCVVGTAQDITERKQLEEQVRRAQMMESIGRLAGRIAHDFNNILGTIMAYAELARTDMPGDKPGAECLREVLAACNRAKELISQIHAFSRHRQLERHPIRLQPIVTEVLKFIQPLLPNNVEIVSDIASDAPVVLANEGQIHQVLMNLCTNAAHAMRGKSGRLNITLARSTVGPDLARSHPNLSPGEYAHLTVSDTGCGMSTETLNRIFEPFFTTKPSGEGTGLGLSVVHGIVQEHRGAITVESIPNVGTTFDLYFPSHQNGEAPK
jgi:two-component system, cell cycle sensor histidine kinase and response regulator CckA